MSGGFDRLLELLEARAPVRRNGREYRTLCPAHDDHNPSLDVAEGENGVPLATCRSRGCTFEQVLEALGTTPAELLGGDRQGDELAVYRYADEAAAPLFEVVRKPGKQFPQRRPSGEWGIAGVRRVLYRLPAVLEAVAAGETIYVAEGEKDVHALERLGLVATCNPGGAKKWTDPAYADALAGATRVVVLGDDDADGRAHAEQVARSLVGRVDELKTVGLYPRGDTKRDVSDWIAQEAEDAELMLDVLVEQAPVYEPPADEGLATSDPTVTFAEFVERRDESTSGPLITCEQGTLLHAGGLVILVATVGHGKTTLSVDGVLHAGAGLDYVGLSFARPLRVLVIENEGPREAFREKLEARLVTWEHDGEPRIWDVPAEWGSVRISDPATRERLRGVIEAHRIDLVVSDSLTRFGVRGNGTPEETREFVEWLTELGLGRDVAFLLLAHPRTRPEKGEPELERLAGAWPPHADAILLLVRRDGNRARLSFPKTRWTKAQPPPSILAFDPETESFSYVGVDEAEQRDYVAELAEFMADGEWWTVTALRKPKAEGGVGAGPDVIKTALADERFESVTGDEIGKRKDSTYYRLGEASRPPYDGRDAMTLPLEEGEASRPSPSSKGDGRRDASSERDSSGEDGVAEDELHRRTGDLPAATWDVIEQVADEMREHAGREPSEDELLAELSRRGYASAKSEGEAF